MYLSALRIKHLISYSLSCLICYVNLMITVVNVCGSQWLAMALDYIIILWFCSTSGVTEL